MTGGNRRIIVILGMMTRMPVGGNIWLVLQYLLGFRRLGFDVYYVEAHGITPTKMMERADDDGSAKAAAFIEAVMARFDAADRWAFHSIYDDRHFGLSESQLKRLYESAELLINLHGGTVPLPEHSATGRLVYLETDPVQLQVEIHDHDQAAVEFLSQHVAFFSWGLNYGKPDCRVPQDPRFHFKPTCPPVLLDFWAPYATAPGGSFTTIGNWRQPGQVVLDGETYYWSKDREFRKFLDLPRRVEQQFELALSSTSYRPRDVELLQSHGWSVRDSLGFSEDLDAYRRYIAGSRGEFTVAKDQNVRLRSGWFSERSATYLAAGRPVVTQDTGFGNVVPTGEGLFAFSTLDEAIAAVERINGDYARHSRAAREIAREHFDHAVVLGRLLAEVGVSAGVGRGHAPDPDAAATAGATAPPAGEPEANAARRLIVNADEFGRSRGVNRGIGEAHERGIVTSASLMVRAAAAEEAAAYARAHPELSVGLHVDLGEWVYRDGRWQRRYDVVPADDEAAVAREVSAQVERFRELLGRHPTHLDTHDGSHEVEPVRSVLRRTAGELRVPLRGDSPGVRHCGEFYGQTREGTPVSDLIAVEALCELLRDLPPGTTELACHPGYADDLDVTYREERALEVRTLCDPRIRETVLEEGIQLSSFHEPPPIRSAAPAVAREDAASPPRLRRYAVAAAVERHLEEGDALSAWHLVRAADEAQVGRRVLVRVARALRAAGWLAEARDAIACAARRHPADAAAAQLSDALAGELSVLAGGWRAPDMRVERLAAVPGRILHVVGASLPHSQSGYSVRTQYICLAQRQAGFEPHVVTELGFPGWEGRMPPSLEEVDGVPYHRLLPGTDIPGRLDDRLTANAVQLADAVRGLRPALLHAASDFLNARLALTVGRAFGLPVVYEVRGFWEETECARRGGAASTGDAYRWRREREGECLGAADRIVTLADAMKAELVHRGLPDDRIAVVPNAVDADRFVPVDRDPHLAARLGIGRDEPVAGYISTLTVYEGVRYLIDAIALLSRRGCPVRGLIVGDGPDREPLIQHAVSMGVGDKVVFQGRVAHDDVLRYYGLIDVFVVPRTADRVCHLVTPLKPFEAMSSGRALVVSRVDALTEIVQEGVTGLTFRPEDAGDLADVVEPLLGDVERRRALGQAARRWVCEHRTWAHVGERYRRVYQSLGIGAALRGAGEDVRCAGLEGSPV